MSRCYHTIATCLLLMALFSQASQAYWIGDGVPVCSAFEEQHFPAIASDSSGGAIIAWQDYRSGGPSIYVQRLDANGEPVWTTNGVAICTNTGISPQVVSDGLGGAIVTWQDDRSGEYDIYAQRIDKNGNLLWGSDGVAVCSATGGQYDPMIATDGQGGAIIAWEDRRSGTGDIYAQRVAAGGDAIWTTNGVPICTVSGAQGYVAMIPNGSGGAIITWQDERSGTSDVYVQMIDRDGNCMWTADGVAICTAPNLQCNIALTSDGSGGAIIVWTDDRAGTYDANIYAQRVSSSGSVLWTSNGVGICTRYGSQGQPVITGDGSGGEIIAWTDMRGTTYYDVYAQRVDGDGNCLWASDGIPVCTLSGYQGPDGICSDGSGGAIITWTDMRSGNHDIYAQRLDGSGSSCWTTNGVAICTATDYQAYAAMTSDGLGGAIITWVDKRSGQYDIYAQQVDSYGRAGYLIPEIHSITDVPYDQGGYVYLRFYATRGDIFAAPTFSHYTIWRALDPALAGIKIAAGASVITTCEEIAPHADRPVIRMQVLGASSYFWELIATQDGYHLDSYAITVPTLFDSTSVCRAYHHFQVIAHSTDPAVFWISEVDSAYSVDNLAPDPPRGLAGEASSQPQGVVLSWLHNKEPDLAKYAIYRGLSEDFIPSPGNRIASVTDTTWFDSEWRADSLFYYKVTAIDIHDNESDPALLRPEDVSGIPGGLPEFRLVQNKPNPFRSSTRIAFVMHKSAKVSLSIYDAKGRLVRSLYDGIAPSGWTRLTWDGTDSRSRKVANGIYFCTLRTGKRSQTIKIVLAR